MAEIGSVVILFEWVNLLISVYLLYRLIFQTPLICVDMIETSVALYALIILIIGRIAREAVEFRK